MSGDERTTPRRPARPGAERKKDRKAGYGEAMKDLPTGPITAPGVGRRPVLPLLAVAVALALAVVALIRLT